MFSATTGQLIRYNPVTMRDAPDVTFDDAVANYTVMTSRTTNAVTAVGTNTSTISTMSISLTCGATSVDGDGAVLRSTRAQSTVSVDAELLPMQRIAGLAGCKIRPLESIVAAVVPLLCWRVSTPSIEAMSFSYRIK